MQRHVGADPARDADVPLRIELKHDLHVDRASRNGERRGLARRIAQPTHSRVSDLDDAAVGIRGLSEADELVADDPAAAVACASSTNPESASVRSVLATVERGRSVSRASSEADAPAARLETAWRSRIARSSDCVRGVLI